MANYCIMNNEKLPPARMQVQNLVDGKQGIKFAWPYNKQWLLSVQGILGKSGFIVRLKHGYNFIPH